MNKKIIIIKLSFAPKETDCFQKIKNKNHTIDLFSRIAFWIKQRRKEKFKKMKLQLNAIVKC